MKTYHVYILKCSDNSFYTGISNNLKVRLAQHHEGCVKTAYTYSRRPLELVFAEVFQDVRLAIEWEKRIKGWSRAKKEALISDNWETLKELSICQNPSRFIPDENYLKGRDGRT